MGYKLRIALRYLLAPKSHAAVNVISLVSLCGVAVAVAAIVCVLSVFNGFSQLATANANTVNPDILITPVKGKTITATDSICRLIMAIDGVNAISPVAEERGLAIGDNGQQIPVRFIGVSDNFADVSRLPLSIIDGVYGLSSVNDQPLTTLSVGVAINLEMQPGPQSQIGLIVPRRQGRINPANVSAAFRVDTLTVAGVFQTDIADFDTDILILPIEHARQLLQYDQQSSSALYVAVSPDATDSDVASAIRAIDSDGNFSIKNRTQQQETEFRIIAIEKWITFALMGFILLVASFNIISTMSMLIVEKSSTIAILRSLGSSRDDVVAIFNRAGWLICLTGVAAGLILGSILCLIQQYFGIIHLNGDSASLITNVYPVDLQPLDLLAVAAISLIVALATSLFTAPFTRRYLTGNNI